MSRTERTRAGDRLWPTLVTVGAMASLPYLTLLAANVGEVLEVDRVVTWWAVTLGAGFAPVAIALRAGREAARWVGAVVAVALFVFFNYPAIVELADGIGGPVTDLQWWLLAFALSVGAAIPVLRRAPAQRFLAIWAPALLLLPLAQLVTAGPAGATPDSGPVDGSLATFEQTPNVYWFVLDGLAAPPFLRQRVGVDPDDFLAHLERNAFRVPERSRSNYPFTHLALASALEMEYLYEGVEEPAAGPYFERTRGDNLAVETFRANGYRYVQGYPGVWGGTRCSGIEDVCIGDHGAFSDTEYALASRTPLIDVLIDEDTTVSIAAANDPHHVVTTALAAATDAPVFALLHVLNPHPPYLRDAGCRLRDVPLTLAAWGEGEEYGDAVTCLFAQLRDAVDAIVSQDDDPVIIITGDHGPRLGLGPDTSGEVLLEDEMYFSAFNAIRLPRTCADTDVPDDLTFVNTLRIVFACLAGERPVLLPDRTFPILRDY